MAVDCRILLLVCPQTEISTTSSLVTLQLINYNRIWKFRTPRLLVLIFAYIKWSLSLSYTSYEPAIYLSPKMRVVKAVVFPVGLWLDSIQLTDNWGVGCCVIFMTMTSQSASSISDACRRVASAQKLMAEISARKTLVITQPALFSKHYIIRASDPTKVVLLHSLNLLRRAVT